jgi:hypothetical protein
MDPKDMVAYLLTSAVGGGIITALVNAWLQREQNRAKARADRATAEKSEVETDNLELIGRRAGLELLSTLMEKVETYAAKVLALEEERRASLMREVLFKDQITQQGERVTGLRNELAVVRDDLTQTRAELGECMARWDQLHEISGPKPPAAEKGSVSDA